MQPYHRATVRRTLAWLSVLLALAACAREPAGPAAPISREQLGPAAALSASAARQAVVDFVHAYAASPTEGARRLFETVAGDELQSWVRWLEVQHREFAGGVAAASEIRDVEFIDTLATPDGTLTRVGLSATVTFDYTPDDADPFQLARILDGPVILAQGGPGRYRVLDLLRDGVPMADGIEVFRDQTRADGGVQVVLDSLFMFPPFWQFNVVVRNGGDRPVTLDPDVLGLYVATPGDSVELDERDVSDSLLVVPPGTRVEGVIAYEQQDAAEGRTFTMAYAQGRREIRFDFPLDGLVTVVPPLPPG
jgi:hypothetical protein